MFKSATCIVALLDENNGQIWMGADGAAVSGYSLHEITYPKIFIKDEKFLIGYTSSFRMGQLIECVFKPPKIPQGKSNYQYLITLFIPSLMKCLSENKFTTEKENVSTGGEFLIGFNSEIFKIQPDFAVLQPNVPYMATGCSEDLALGSLFTTEMLSNPSSYESYILPHKRLEIALQAASKFSAGVSNPFTILSLF